MIGDAEAGGSVASSTVYIPDGLFLRSFRMIRPAVVGPGERLPVVVVIHGLGMTADQMATLADWRGQVAARRFIAVFPQGYFNAWNTGSCCVSRADDVGFVRTVVRKVLAFGSADPARVHLVGFSLGGMMAYRLACTLPGTFVSMAVVAGLNPSTCAPSVPLSTLHVHGLDDEVITYTGVQSFVSWFYGVTLRPILPMVESWAAGQSCTPTTVETALPLTRRHWSCTGGRSTELVEIAGQRHGWPRPPLLDPLPEILEFFGLEAPVPA